MPRIKEKGKSGNAKNYLTRSQAVRKLQITLPDFRRLCIFKGIYPREPRSKKRVSKSSTPSTTYYYTKDIQYLLHEPLLNKFRDQKALAKKISKALGRNEVSDASRLEKNHTPRLRLDHIIKERYPTFVDALRDLDDALSMLFLFANLPSSDSVPPKTITKCQRLTHEFEHYLIRTHSLRKSFLSIKGIYYQATIQGQDILWLVPYRFVQRAGLDVDFRIMATFVDFYTTLLGFVNYRLYTSIGLVYPPKFDALSEEHGAELDAFKLEGQGEKQLEDGNADVEMDTETHERAQAEANRLLSLPETAEAEPTSPNTVPQSSYVTAPETSDPAAEAKSDEMQPVDAEPQTGTTLDTFSSIDASADALLQPSRTSDAAIAAQLFEPFTIFLSRETPRHPLEFLLKSFGCKRVAWDSTLGEGSYCSESDKRITHQIVDRPEIPLPTPPTTDAEEDLDSDGEVIPRKTQVRVPGRTYIQPQWVWDSINMGKLQRPDLYASGAELPPHLSPWVKPKAGEYDPTVPLAEQEAEGEAEAAAFDAEEVDTGSSGEEVDGVRGDSETEALEENLTARGGKEVAQGEGMDVGLADSEDDEETAAASDEDDGEWGGFSGDEDADPTLSGAAKAARDHQAELEAEALGLPTSKKADGGKAAVARQAAQAKRTKEERAKEEEIERRKQMAPRRKRKMYEKMVYSNARKDEEAEKLRGKRRRIEQEQAKGKKGAAQK
ncbi:hypothetical protein MBLNU230_g2397t1 [Neophaeotheca triangularis]